MNNTTNIQILGRTIPLRIGASFGINATDPDVIQEELYQVTKQYASMTILIDEHEMLYDTMTALEYLMFATKHIKKTKTRLRQKEFLEQLISVGLGYISLTPIRLLTPQEKMLLLLWCGLFSQKEYIIFNVTKYEFDDELILCMKKIIERFKKDTTALIIGTLQPKLIGICLEETLFIHEKKILYYGLVSALQHCMDRVLYVIKHANEEELVKQLVKVFPMYEIKSGNQLIFVMRKKTTNRDDEMFFETLAKEKIVPDMIKINHGRMENSFQELIEYNAILK